jgi:hypothetical protein
MVAKATETRSYGGLHAGVVTRGRELIVHPNVVTSDLEVRGVPDPQRRPSKRRRDQPQRSAPQTSSSTSSSVEARLHLLAPDGGG